MNHLITTSRANFRRLCMASALFLLPFLCFSQVNNPCAGALPIVSSPSCGSAGNNVSGSLTGATSYTPIGSACGTNRKDVWYSFTAQSVNPTITITTSLGSPRFQVYTAASCGGTVTSKFCSAGASGTVTPALTIGQPYLIRVYSNSDATGNFTICVVDPPVNDLCANAQLLTTATSCGTPTSGLLNASATYTSDATTDACGTSNNDVWYKFVAKSLSETIALSSAPSGSRFQVLSGTCGSFVTSLYCGAGPTTVANLTLGDTYYIRVYSTSNSTGTFGICATDITPNDNCSGAVVLTSATVCNNISGTIYGATNSSQLASPTCASSIVADTWYKFVAKTTNPTIKLSSIGVNFAGANMELLGLGSSNACPDFISLYCGTTINSDYLTVGSTYFIRVYSTSAAPASPVNAGFSLCVQDPVTTDAPFNDECVNAVNLPVGLGCSNFPGSMAAATPSSVAIGSCASPVVYDVWYKFTAIGTSATITLSTLGADFLTPNIQVLTGTCGSLGNVICGASPQSPSTLVVGNVYYVRVYSTSAPVPNGNARFNICVTNASAPLKFGNSYVNISKKKTGGVVEKGDTLEIRMTVNLNITTTMYGLRYVDNVPTNTDMLTGTTDSIRLITNEGLTFRRYTLAGGDDAATYKSSLGAGEYNVRLNIGLGSTSPGIPANNTATETASATGQMFANASNSTLTDKPRGGGGVLFATSYRVVVTGNPGSIVNLNAGKFIYKTTAGGSDIVLTSTPYAIMISNPLSLCANSIGVNNALESGGTFGSGATLNRNTDLASPIGGYSFLSDVNAYNGINDGRYAIVNNSSPRSSTVSTARRKNSCALPTALMANDPDGCNARMFGGFWYVAGDHTGTNNAIGNPAPAAGVNSGYMLMVNADFVASEAYRQTVSNLCPNTYYEFSAWFRNICPTCGIDSTATSLYNPGVNPNLSFSLNNTDYYSTGEIDTVGWVKKGFVFVTGPSQTSASFSIRNNSQGGGGNDWAMDDIAIATCLPNMRYSPSLNPTVCEGNILTINDTISSYFNNYTHHVWQKSTNHGNTWTDVSTIRDSLPVFNAIENSWQYVTSFTIPPSNTNTIDSGTLYRVIVATSADNVSSPSCQVTDGISIINLAVLDCTPVLSTELLMFNAILVDDKGHLNWTTSKEERKVRFNIERSDDGTNFFVAGSVGGHNNPTALSNYYSFVDPVATGNKVFYRVVMANDNKNKYSRAIQLNKNGPADFAFVNVINPFNQSLEFDINSPVETRAEAEILDMFGKVVKKASYLVHKGTNTLSIFDTGYLPAGAYVFRVKGNGQVISKKVLKKNLL